MEKMRLGRTEMLVSRVGFGGIPIQRASEEGAIAVVRRCLELGINFIDTARGYSTSEGRIGKAIAGQRDGLILATKSTARNGEEMRKHLKTSMEQLGVEYIDLFQFHNVNSYNELNALLAADGAMPVVKEARKAGLIKHIGITSHSLDMAKELVKLDRFETIMFPFNFVTSEAANELLPLAREHDVGFIAMKPMAGGMLNNVNLALKYLLQFPDVLALVGIEKVHEIEEVVEVVEGPQEISSAEQKEMSRLREELGTKFCHRCDYCQPCTEGIPISTVMVFPGFMKRMPPGKIFSGFVAEAMEKGASCSKCGECEQRCPYGLPISAMVEEYVGWYQEEKRKYQEKVAAG